jgi:hypothetical protein
MRIAVHGHGPYLGKADPWLVVLGHSGLCVTTSHLRTAHSDSARRPFGSPVARWRWVVMAQRLFLALMLGRPGMAGWHTWLATACSPLVACFTTTAQGEVMICVLPLPLPVHLPNKQGC